MIIRKCGEKTALYKYKNEQSVHNCESKPSCAVLAGSPEDRRAGATPVIDDASKSGRAMGINNLSITLPIIDLDGRTTGVWKKIEHQSLLTRPKGRFRFCYRLGI